MNAILFWLIMAVLSIFLIVKAAGYAVDSMMRYAKKTRFSHYFVGLMVISIGTSLPEIFTAIISSLEGRASLVLGDAMGATILDVTLVLPMVAIVLGSYKLSKGDISINWYKVLPVAALPLLLALDGRLSRPDGIVMLLAFALYYGSSIYVELKKQKIVSSIPLKFFFREAFVFCVNLALLIFGTQVLVFSSSNLSMMLHIPPYIFGALFLSLCTTSPEFMVELKAIFSKSAPIAFGDIFGSVVCNTSLVLGIASFISPVRVPPHFYSVGLFMLLSLALSLFFMNGKALKRWEGFVLLLCYLIFVSTQISSLIGKGLFFGLV